MAGVKENWTWDVLKRSLLLELAADSVTNTYLGCNQASTDIDEQFVRENNDMFSKLITPHEGFSIEENRTAAQLSFEESNELRD